MAMDDWDNVTNPYTGARAGSAVPAEPANPNQEWIGVRNPYRNPDAPPGTGAAPWTEMPRNPYDDAATVARDADRLEALGRVEADRAARIREAIDRLVGSKKSGKAAAEERAREAPRAESVEERRLRLYRELHALDAGTERMARGMGVPSEREASRGLREIDRGTERMARELGVPTGAAAERDLAQVDRGTADLARRLRMVAPRYGAPPAAPAYAPPAEAEDPRLRALDEGNARFAGGIAAVPALTLTPNLRY